MLRIITSKSGPSLTRLAYYCRKFSDCKQPSGKGSTKEIVRPEFHKLKENQKKFSQDDGVPVFLKGGMIDKVLYQSSWALVILGLGLTIQTFVRLIMK